MITHDEMRKETNGLGLLNASGKYDYDVILNTVVLLDDYITQQEQLERDVKRYFELIKGKMPNEEALEYIEVTQRLLKVGEMK